jgi:hypothetical protein
MMISNREVELELQFLRTKYQELEQRINCLLDVKSRWISINKASSFSMGKLSAHQIKRKIESTIASPISSDLIEGKHFAKIVSSIGICRYKVFWPEFNQVWTDEKQL